MEAQNISIRQIIFQQILFDLNEQYEKETFEVNQSLRHSLDIIFHTKESWNEDVSETEKLEIREELTLFMFGFIKAPSIWAQLLTNDEIEAKTTQIIINQPETLTKVYRKIIKEVNQLIVENQAKAKGKLGKDEETQEKLGEIDHFDFEKMYFDHGTKNLMASLLNTIAQEICKFFSQGKNLIQTEAKAVEEEIKNSEIMNAYFLFGILKQMSVYTYQKVEESMSLYFKNLPTQSIHKFCEYVQKNYEYVELICKDQDPKIFTKEEMEEHITEKNEFWLNFIKNIDDKKMTLKRIESDHGEKALAIVKKPKNEKEQENEESFEDAEELILKIDKHNKIIITNAKATQKEWKIFDIKDSVSGLYKIMKQELSGQASDKIEKEIITYGVSLGQYANFGGNVGRCLADINKYKSANHFLMDLSKSTVISGSVSYILVSVPILSYFMIAGGLTYTFYHTFNNQATSTLKKFKQLGKTSVTAMGSVGSAVAGMMLGQSLIPVPFLGAFVGGVIGGFLGQTGTNLMTKLMAKESFKNLINYLKGEIVDDRFWRFSPKLLEKLGLSSKYFNEQVCPKESKKDAYITAICFCIVTFYESQRYIARNEEKMAELEKENTNKSERELLNEEEIFDNEFNVVQIIDYLTENHIVLLHEHEKLQSCIRHSVI